MTLPGGNEVKYCDVSMIPPNWYQWFDQSYSDDDDSQWDVVSFCYVFICFSAVFFVCLHTSLAAL